MPGRCGSWASTPTGYGSFGHSIRARVPMPSTSTTPTTATRKTSRTFWPSSRPRGPACMTGSTNDWRGTDTLDAPLPVTPGVPAAAGLDSAGAGGDRLHLPVLHGARALAARQEQQDVTGKPPNRVFPHHPAGAGENPAATSGFVGVGSTVAPGDSDRALPARRSSAGPAAGGRR